jgi:ubiquinone biosynthesis protein COQ4
VKYIDQHDFSPDERTVVRFMMDEDAAYVMTRYRQVHDFWHVLADLPPTILGEIALKAFEFQVSTVDLLLIVSGW